MAMVERSEVLETERLADRAMTSVSSAGLIVEASAEEMFVNGPLRQSVPAKYK
jgi:hypothetical protein